MSKADNVLHAGRRSQGDNVINLPETAVLPCHAMEELAFNVGFQELKRASKHSICARVFGVASTLECAGGQDPNQMSQPPDRILPVLFVVFAVRFRIPCSCFILFVSEFLRVGTVPGASVSPVVVKVTLPVLLAPQVSGSTRALRIRRVSFPLDFARTAKAPPVAYKSFFHVSTNAGRASEVALQPDKSCLLFADDVHVSDAGVRPDNTSTMLKMDRC